MTRKEYIQKLNDLRRLYIRICNLMADVVLKNYEKAFGYHDLDSIPNSYSNEFYEQKGKWDALYDQGASIDTVDVPIQDSLLIWKQILEAGANVLEFAQEHMSPAEFADAFKEGGEGLTFISQVWGLIKYAKDLKKDLQVSFSDNSTKIETLLETNYQFDPESTDSKETNQSSIANTSDEENLNGESSDFVKYSEYKLLLKRMKILENTLKQLKDELEVVHSQLDYLTDNKENNDSNE